MGQSPGRRAAIAGGVLAGLVAASWIFLRHPADDTAHGGAPHASASRAPAKSGWLPWFLGGEGGSSNPKSASSAYKGPRVAVTVKVKDVEGRPVVGADVSALADKSEYELSGLDDEQAEKYLAEHPEPEEEEKPDAPPPDHETDGIPLRVAVESGRTGRDGIWIAQLKPDVSVLFEAKDAGREGVSGLVYAYGADGETEPDAKPAPLEVTIEIAEVATLSGLVADDRGTPIAGADLRLGSWSQSEFEPEQIVGRKDPSGALITGADGRFHIPLRTSGAFDLEVHAKKFQPVTRQAVQVLPGRQTDLVITMHPSVEIAGIVIDGSGSPVASARVAVQGDPKRADYVSTETLSGDDGKFVAQELPPGVFTVSASAEGFRPAEIWNVASGGGEVTLRLLKGGSIHGTVTIPPAILATIPDVYGVPLDAERGELPRAQADVYLSAAGTDEDTIPLATGVPRGHEADSPAGSLDKRGRYFTSAMIGADGQGTFDVAGLPSGIFAVTVMSGAMVATVPGIRIWEGGTTTVAVELPDRSAARVRGIVRSADGKPIAEGSAFLYGPLPSGLSTLVGADGRFEFASVPAGEYMVHAVVTWGASEPTRNGFAPTRSIHVDPGSTTEVELIVGGADELGGLGLAGTDTSGEIVSLDENSGRGEPAAEWMPDIEVEQIDEGLVVTSAAPVAGGKRLFGGDRVREIDGHAVATMESWEALELLYGAKDSICTITADRPATNESITVGLPRVRAPETTTE